MNRRSLLYCAQYLRGRLGLSSKPRQTTNGKINKETGIQKATRNKNMKIPPAVSGPYPLAFARLKLAAILIWKRSDGQAPLPKNPLMRSGRLSDSKT